MFYLAENSKGRSKEEEEIDLGDSNHSGGRKKQKSDKKINPWFSKTLGLE